MMTGMLLSARNCCTTSDVWLGALPWCRHHSLCHSPCHLSRRFLPNCIAQAFLSLRNHRTLRISLRVTSGCSILRKWASRGLVSQPWKTSNRIRRPNSGRFQKKPSAFASNNGRIDGASVCVRKGPTSKLINTLRTVRVI